MAPTKMKHIITTITASVKTFAAAAFDGKPITDVAPTWIVLSWPEKRAIDGVVQFEHKNKRRYKVSVLPVEYVEVTA